MSADRTALRERVAAAIDEQFGERILDVFPDFTPEADAVLKLLTPILDAADETERWNKSVRVCPGHTEELTNDEGGCVLCDWETAETGMELAQNQRDELRAAADELAEAVERLAVAPEHFVERDILARYRRATEPNKED